MDDVIFFNLHRRYVNHQPGYGGFLGIYQLAAFLKGNGYHAQGFSGSFMEGKRLLDQVCQSGEVALIGLYCDYANETENIFLSHYVKETYGLPVIVGGPQATSLREEFMAKSGCDAVVRYEGELTVLALAQYFIDGSGSLESMMGIMTYENGVCHIHAERPVIENLDALPLVDDTCYIYPGARASELSIMTGRGCPFHCAFCHEGHHSRKVRFRSVENVLQEIHGFLEAKAKRRHVYIMFTDDTFTLVPKRVHDICEGLKELKKSYDFTWYCEGHVHMLYKNPQMIDDMAAAGCLRIQLGIESGNQTVLDAYNKGCTLEEIETVIQHAMKVGIEQIFGNIILGSAFATKETYENDKAFAKHLIRMGEGRVELGVVSYWPLAETPMTSNPDDYGIQIIDGRFEQAADDFPQVRTKALSRLEISYMVQQLQLDLDAFMKDMLRQGQIDTKRILYWFELAEGYRVAGNWFHRLSEMPLEYAYYEMLHTGETCESKELTKVEFYNAHPMRVLSLNSYITYSDEENFDMFDLHLSSIDQQVLLYSAGKLSVKEIARRLCAHTEQMERQIENVTESLKHLEKAHLILYSRY